MMTLKDIYGDLLPENEPDLEIGNIEKREDESVISSGRASTRGSVTGTINTSAYDRYRNAYITGSAPTLNRAVPLPFDNVEMHYNPRTCESECFCIFGSVKFKIAGDTTTVYPVDGDDSSFHIDIKKDGTVEFVDSEREQYRRHLEMTLREECLYEGA